MLSVPDTAASELDGPSLSFIAEAQIHASKEGGGWNRRSTGLSEELVSSIYSNEMETDVIIERSRMQSVVPDGGRTQSTVPDGERTTNSSLTLTSFTQFINSFSAAQNCRKIFSTSIPKDDLNFVHGVRFLRKNYIK